MRYAAAQELKVQVNAGNEPVAYSYIFINKRIIGNADSSGVYILDKNKLHIGDTISASFIGNIADVLYDNALAASGECVIDLGLLLLSEVVVTPGADPYKLYRKYVKIPEYGLRNFHKFDTYFNYSEKAKGITSRECEGDISIYFYYETVAAKAIHKNKILRIKTSGDTTGIIPYLIYELESGISLMPFYSRLAKRTSSFDLKYLGLNEGNHVFTRSLSWDGTIVQLKIYANKNTSHVNQIDYYYYRNQDNNEIYGKREAFYIPNKRGKELILRSINSYWIYYDRASEYFLQMPAITVSRHVEKQKK